MNDILNISVYIMSFAFCLYAISAINFEKICYVSNPYKVRLLMILMAIGLAYLVAQFLLMITIYH